MRVTVVFWAIFILTASLALADERILSKKDLEKGRFKPFSGFKSPGTQRFSEPPTNLIWPVKFRDEKRNIAQNYVQHQDYGGGQYYHKGCDLLALPGSDVKATVSGILEG